MNILLTSDLHLNSNPRDADRWNLFPWLREQIKKHRVTKTMLLGDLTDAKDCHPSTLVNRISDELNSLALKAPVTLLKGNHDYIEQELPFFLFVNQMARKIRFISVPTYDNENDFIFLPHTRDHKQAWSGLDFKQAEYIFCHQTFTGALAENGTVLHGIDPKVFADTDAKIWSGDIHTPQRIKNSQIEYVGTPYRVHFGDTYKPRVVLIGNGEVQNLYFPGKGRELIVGGNLEDIKRHDFVMGTQVKIRVKLRRSEYPEWPSLRKQIRKVADKRGWEVCGIELKARKVKRPTLEQAEATGPQSTPEDELSTYGKAKKADKPLMQQGFDFLEEAKK